MVTRIASSTSRRTSSRRSSAVGGAGGGQQPVDVVAVAGVGRHAARRRVRVREQAELLEHRELVADRRGPGGRRPGPRPAPSSRRAGRWPRTRRPPCESSSSWRGVSTPSKSTSGPTRHASSPSSRTARNASCGTSMRPTCFIRRLPSFCFSSSLRLRRDVAAVALRRDVLAERLDGLAGDDLRARPPPGSARRTAGAGSSCAAARSARGPGRRPCRGARPCSARRPGRRRAARRA